MRHKDRSLLDPWILLVADRDPLGIRALRRAGVEHGFLVLHTRDGMESLRLARLFHPDALIADLDLPGLGGVDLAGILAHDPATADVRVIVRATRQISSEVARDAIAARAAACVEAACPPDRVVEIVARVLRIAALKRRTLFPWSREDAEPVAAGPELRN